MENEREAIRNQLARFARILDSRAWDSVGEVFADEVRFHYGDGREQGGIEAMREQFRAFLDGCGPSQHLLGSIAIEPDGEGYLSRTYVQARHQGRRERADRIFDTHGDYVDRWRRIDGAWKIVRRDVAWSMHIGDPTVLGPGD